MYLRRSAQAALGTGKVIIRALACCKVLARGFAFPCAMLGGFACPCVWSMHVVPYVGVDVHAVRYALARHAPLKESEAEAGPVRAHARMHPLQIVV